MGSGALLLPIERRRVQRIVPRYVKRILVDTGDAKDPIHTDQVVENVNPAIIERLHQPLLRLVVVRYPQLGVSRAN